MKPYIATVRLAPTDAGDPSTSGKLFSFIPICSNKLYFEVLSLSNQTQGQLLTVNLMTTVQCKHCPQDTYYDNQQVGRNRTTVTCISTLCCADDLLITMLYA